MVHDVGACVVNALCVICPIKVVKICKIDKNRSEIQRKMWKDNKKIHASYTK